MSNEDNEPAAADPGQKTLSELLDAASNELHLLATVRKGEHGSHTRLLAAELSVRASQIAPTEKFMLQMSEAVLGRSPDGKGT